MKNLESQSHEEHPTWLVSFNPNGSLNGLPIGISRKNVILFIGNDGKWYAQNPSPERLKEIEMWRTDWKKGV